ncbi:hypothetical protein [Mameliella alba]|uniref:hypothetical protein n=1 Tax=Mameliella alba TaxID=561184 RepID=UPI000B52B891|nr:hypothetical protein [Mameliella alba]MBY6119084.1 hypothetical protein [Mameliella alba]OWV43990.1 hypothetical protein CDZ95_10110 [Mameliella alba]OWV67661.1 hypothetical protein CDZ97_04340 [Mameliella alba]
MRRLTLLACLLGTFGLTGCDVDGGGLDRARQHFGVTNPKPSAFHVCGSHNCRKRVAVSLSPAEWSSARAPLRSRPRTPGAERRALAETLRRLEVVVGRKTGYDSDRAGSTLQMGVKAQDCVDEMVNTAVYLKMLDDAGDLRFHRPGQRVTIGFMTREFWTHTVASIYQKDTGQEFIVETWAVDFGETPYIMDRKAWSANEPLRRDF